MFVTGPNVVKTVTHEDVDAEFLGGATTHTTRSGVAHLAARDEATAFDLRSSLLAYLPANNLGDAPRVETSDPIDRQDVELDTDHPRRPAPRRTTCTTSSAESSTTARCSRSSPRGHRTSSSDSRGSAAGAVGIVATAAVRPGRSARHRRVGKAARFVRTCDAFNVPLVTFVDVPGFLPGVEQEHGGIIRHGAKLLYAYCEATVPKLTVITRKAYGGAYDVMSSKHIRGDVNLAWPTAEIAVMGADGAVSIIYRDELAAASDRRDRTRATGRVVRGRVREPVRRGGTRLRRRRDQAVRDAPAAHPVIGDAGRQAGDQSAEEAWQHPALTRVPTTRRPGPRPQRVVFAQRRAAVPTGPRSPTAGEIAVRIIRACQRPGWRPSLSTATPTRTRCMSGRPTSRSASGRRHRPRAICGSTRSWPRRLATGCDADPPGVRVPRRARGLRARRDRRRPRLRRTDGRDHRGGRRQARGASARQGRRRRHRAGDPGARARRPGGRRRRRDRRRRADRLPTPRQGRGRGWGTGDAPRGARRRSARRARGRDRRGRRGVRRWGGLPGARDPAGAPHRGAAPRRRSVAASWPSGSATARSSGGTRSSSRRRRPRA